MSSGPYKEAKHEDIYFSPSLHRHPAMGLPAPSPWGQAVTASPWGQAAPAPQAVGLGEAASQPGQAFWKLLPPPGATHHPVPVPGLFSFRIPAKPT